MGGTTSAYQGSHSGIVAQFGLFYVHVFEFARLKDFATLDALDELGVAFPSHDLHPGMLARATILLLVRRR